ncbi:MAG: exonuclease domain-containing protein [Actinomycetaceae bacterium]|nr:exonuclease domain-containing protein [Actinomycetaceae bacterium]
MWSESEVIGFDTETTGVRPREDRLVTCSIVEVSRAGVEKHYWLADPGVEIPERASAVHGITTEEARANGRPIEEVLEEIASRLANHMVQSRPVVAFNATYDFTLVEAELQRHGLDTLAMRLGGEVFPVVDPYLLDRSVDRFRKGKRRLEDLCRHYGVFDEDDFHNAEADVLATLRLLGAMLRKYPELAQQDLEEIQMRECETHAEFMEFLARKAADAGRPFTDSFEWPVAE